MCINCYIEAGSPKIVNEKVLEAARLIQQLYETENGGAGGYGHIVFDDWNVDDSDIDFCINQIAADQSIVDNQECRIASQAALLSFKELAIGERYSALALLL